MTENKPRRVPKKSTPTKPAEKRKGVQGTPFNEATRGQRCKTIKKNGDQCGNWALKGATVCRYHGGNAPQVRAAAQRRLDLASEIAAVRIVGIMNDTRVPAHVRLAAAREVLDRTGIVTPKQVAVAGEIKYIFDEGDFVVVERETDEDWEAIRYKGPDEQKAVTSSDIVEAEVIDEPRVQNRFDRAVFADVEKRRDREASRPPSADEPGPGLTKAPVYGSEPRRGMNAEQRRAHERMLRERLEDDDRPRARSVKFRRG
jgi:hypothetical protein